MTLVVAVLAGLFACGVVVLSVRELREERRRRNRAFRPAEAAVEEWVVVDDPHRTPTEEERANADHWLRGKLPRKGG